MRSASLLLVFVAATSAFLAPPSAIARRRRFKLGTAPEPPPADTDELASPQETEVGSAEYYKGFVSSPIGDESLPERDPLGGLEQALKLGGSATLVLTALTLGFMASNGLLG